MSGAATTIDGLVEERPVGLWSDALRRMLRNRSAIIGALIVSAMVFMAVFAPFLAPYDPLHGNLSDSFLPPSALHPMGTNIQGQDVLSRIIWGARLTLGIAVLSVTIGVVVGQPLARVSPRQGRYGRLVAGILCYLVYSNLLAAAGVWVSAGEVPAVIGVWWVHLLALVSIAWLFWPAQFWRPRSRKVAA